MPQFVDAEINGVQIKRMVLMKAKYGGYDPYAKERFPAGVTIAFKKESDLTEDQKAAIFQSGYRGSVAIQWPLKEAKTTHAFVPSDFQKEILSALLETNDHIFIEALAGSGKTSTLVWLIKELSKKNLTSGKKIVYLAFNKSIQEELVEKLQGTGVPALTTHAFCFSQILKKHYGNDLKVDKSVVLNAFVQTLISDQGWEDTIARRKDARKLEDYKIKGIVFELIGYVKNWAVCPTYSSSDGWVFSEDQIKTIDEFIDVYEVEIPDGFSRQQIVNRVCRTIAMQLPEPKQSVKTIEFDDMLYFPLVLNLEFPKYDLVLTDESQDFNACQIIILEKLIRS